MLPKKIKKINELEYNTQRIKELNTRADKIHLDLKIKWEETKQCLTIGNIFHHFIDSAIKQIRPASFYFLFSRNNRDFITKSILQRLFVWINKIARMNKK